MLLFLLIVMWTNAIISNDPYIGGDTICVQSTESKILIGKMKCLTGGERLGYSSSSPILISYL